MRKPSCVRHWPCASSAATPRPKPASVPPGTAAGGTCCRKRSSRSGPGWPRCCAPSDGSRRRRRSSKSALLSRCAWRSSVHPRGRRRPASPARAARGDWRTAVDGLRSASAIEPDPHYRHHLHRERALALARLDPRHRAEEVREAARLALADARRAGCERCLVESTTGAAEALARVSERDEAQALLAVAPPPADAYNHLGWLRAQAAVHAAGDDVGQATVAVTAVIAEAEHQCMRLDRAAGRDWTWSMLLIDRAPTDAAKELRAAGSAAETMGAFDRTATGRAASRSLGVRTWRHGAATSGTTRLAALSARSARSRSS